MNASIEVRLSLQRKTKGRANFLPFTMLSISTKLLQAPVLLSTTCSDTSMCQTIPLVGHVTVHSTGSKETGGIKVIWEAKVQRRKRMRNGKYCWTSGDTFDRFEVDVVRGPVILATGESVFEFVIEVPLTLVSTRTTQFDKISHQLHAAILDNTPCYDDLLDASTSSSLTSLLRRIRPKKTISSVFGPTPTLARAIEPVTVFCCNTEEGDTIYNWRYSSEMGGLGHLTVALDSQQFTLGGSADLSIDLTALSPSTTIHSITASLVQTTTRPTCPAKYSTGKSISVEVEEGNRESLDKYQLYSYGTSWSWMAGRMRPFHGSYIWRGAEGVEYVRDSMGEDDLIVERSHPDGFGLSTTLLLPSPIIGANPTTTDEIPAFSTISHHLELKVEYSHLNQDINGEPITHTNSEPMEGSVRTWTLEKSLEIHSDLSSASSTAAPPYSLAATLSHGFPSEFDSTMELRSTKACRYISLGMMKATLMKPVSFTQIDRQKATKRHWEETAGMCACFDSSGMCGTAAQGDTRSSPYVHLSWAGKT